MGGGVKYFYVYFMTNWAGNVMYVGITGDLERRVSEHKARAQDGFTRKYNTTKLVYYETFPDPDAAIAREKQIKKWRREKKDFLVNQTNPQWRDLSEDWYAA